MVAQCDGPDSLTMVSLGPTFGLFGDLLSSTRGLSEQLLKQDRFRGLPTLS